MIQRSVHWTFMSVLAFLLYRSHKGSKSKAPTPLDIVFALLALFASGVLLAAARARGGGGGGGLEGADDGPDAGSGPSDVR